MAAPTTPTPLPPAATLAYGTAMIVYRSARGTVNVNVNATATATAKEIGKGIEIERRHAKGSER